MVMPLGLVSGDILERVRQFECQARVAARDGRIRDGSPWMRCDLVDPAGSLRLEGVPVENVAGTAEYRTRWEAVGPVWPGLLKGLAAGTVHAELVLGVRGGGDYTGPDHLRVVAVAVTGGRCLRGREPASATRPTRRSRLDAEGGRGFGYLPICPGLGQHGMPAVRTGGEIRKR